uniref:Uncharacterized protein n=1 Tax=Ciona savignyi TaxID=51511 RepID=H2ZEQ1_CIOSA
MEGKTIIITGANAGIGMETALDLVRRGGRVIMACRNLGKAEVARDKILQESGKCEEAVVIKQLDLSSLQSIRKFASDINATENRIDVLVNNAGLMLPPETTTMDGFEAQVGVNHLGHFLLVNLLLDLLKRSAPSRIVVVASEAHRIGNPRINWEDINCGIGLDIYCASKLMNILFARELSDRLKGLFNLLSLHFNSLHPGVIRSGLWYHMHDQNISVWRSLLHSMMRPMMNMFWKSPPYGAQTTIFCCVAPELHNVSGKYFSDCAVAFESAAAKSKQDAVRLWNISEKLVSLNGTESFA